MTTKTRYQYLDEDTAKAVGAIWLMLFLGSFLVLALTNRHAEPGLVWSAVVFLGLHALAVAVIVFKEIVLPLLGALGAVFTSITGLFGVTRTEEEVSPLGLRIRRIYRGRKMISSEVVGRI